MSSAHAVEAIAASLAPSLLPQTSASAATGVGSFAQLLNGGIERVEADVRRADALTQAFVLDDSVPVHQVTFALEQARLSVELMMQVRARLVEGYQDLMRMQL